jgi:hypothetical protein
MGHKTRTRKQRGVEWKVRWSWPQLPGVLQSLAPVGPIPTALWASVSPPVK